MKNIYHNFYRKIIFNASALYLSIHFIRTSSGTLLAGLPFFYFFPPLQENNKNQSNFSQSFVYYLVIMVFALFIYRQAIPLSSSVINKVL